MFSIYTKVSTRPAHFRETMRLAQWLRPRSLQAIRLQSDQPSVTIYIGNEAGDLDSGELTAITIAGVITTSNQ